MTTFSRTSFVGTDGFTALSHIEARRAPALRWGPDEIRLLIVKRFSASARLRNLYGIDKARIEGSDHEHVKEVFKRLFPPQVIPGKRQSNTLDWIYHHCEDGRGAVTPRDIIDLLEFAIKAQVEHLQRGVECDTHLISGAALKEGLCELSKKKCRTYLEAEFPDSGRTSRNSSMPKASTTTSR